MRHLNDWRNRKPAFITYGAPKPATAKPAKRRAQAPSLAKLRKPMRPALDLASVTLTMSVTCEGLIRFCAFISSPLFGPLLVSEDKPPDLVREPVQQERVYAALLGLLQYGVTDADFTV